MPKTIILGCISLLGAYFEYCQHADYAKKNPDSPKCPSGVIGFVILSIVSFVFSL